MNKMNFKIILCLTTIVVLMACETKSTTKDNSGMAESKQEASVVSDPKVNSETKSTTKDNTAPVVSKQEAPAVSNPVNSDDDFIGSYSTKPNGQPEVIVTKENGVYYCKYDGASNKLEHKIGRMWDESIDAKSRQCVVDGISGQNYCILKVVKGCSSSLFGNLPTSYYIWSIAGSPLYKL